MAELMLGQPLFPGESGIDQLVEIIKVLGTPTREQIRTMNPNYMEHKFPQIKPHPFNKVYGIVITSCCFIYCYSHMCIFTYYITFIGLPESRSQRHWLDLKVAWIHANATAVGCWSYGASFLWRATRPKHEASRLASCFRHNARITWVIQFLPPR